MNKQLVKTAIAFLGSVLWILLACTTGSAVEKNALTVTDATGKTVEIRLPVKRMIVLTSDALEIVRALGAADRVVGVYSDIEIDPMFWPMLKDRPKVGNWKELNYELAVGLQADTVLCYAQRPGPDMEKKLRPFGIQVIRLDFFKPDTLVKEVEILGQVLEKQENARHLAYWYRQTLDAIGEMVKNGKTPPDVYVEGDSSYHTAGPGSGGHRMCALAGGRNLAEDFAIPYPEVSPEWVLTANPDMIVKVTTHSTCGLRYAMTDPGPLKRIREDILKRPAWHHIKAVQAGNVYVIANEIWTGPRAIIGAAYLAKWFYPDMGGRFDPETLHKEYLETFQGLRFQGEYVYPK